jgi:xanthine dehydrogenase molybdopterin-binding subunit B
VKVVEGDVEIGSQYHFYMETLACIVRPIEDGQVQGCQMEYFPTKNSMGKFWRNLQ